MRASGLIIVAVVLVHGSTCAAGIHRGPASREAMQSPLVVTPSDRVRIQTTSDPVRVPEVLRGRFVGSIVGMNESTLTVAPDGEDPVALSRDLVQELELGVEHGSRSKHALVGALASSCFGAVLGLAMHTDNEWTSPGEDAAIGAVIFGAVGLAVGAILPAGEQWRRLPIERVEWSEEQVSR